MTYELDRPSALFSTHQKWPKNKIGLGARIRVKHGASIVRSPLSWLKRQRWASPKLWQLKALDQARFGKTGYLDTTQGLAAKVAMIVERWGPRCAEAARGEIKYWPVEGYDRSPFALEALIADEYIRSLILDPAVFGTITKYLGEAPVFSGASIWIGRKGERYAGSPYFHLDSEGWGNARLYVYLGSVATGNGPFVYIPRPDSLRFVNKAGYLGRALADETITDFFGGDPSIAVLGPAGTSFLVDTTRCLHYGSRCVDADRWSLIINYRRSSTPNGVMDERLRQCQPQPLAVRPNGANAR